MSDMTPEALSAAEEALFRAWLDADPATSEEHPPISAIFPRLLATLDAARSVSAEPWRPIDPAEEWVAETAPPVALDLEAAQRRAERRLGDALYAAFDDEAFMARHLNARSLTDAVIDIVADSGLAAIRSSTAPGLREADCPECGHESHMCRSKGEGQPYQPCVCRQPEPGSPRYVSLRFSAVPMLDVERLRKATEQAAADPEEDFIAAVAAEYDRLAHPGEPG